MNHWKTLLPKLMLATMAVVLVLGAIPAQAAKPTLRPAISVGPLSHREELRVAVSAHAKLARIELRIDNKKVQPWVKAHAGWKYSIRYPLKKVAVGTHTARLKVWDQKNRSSQRQWHFQKLAQLAISADKSSIQSGEKVTLSGKGFTPGTAITIGMGTQNTVVSGNYGNAVADSSGRFSLEVTLDRYPDGSPLHAGTISLVAHNNDGSEKASVDVRVLPAPGIVLDKGSIKPGEKVTVSGKGFTPGATVSISLGGLNTEASGSYGTATVNNLGGFSVEVLLDRYPDGSRLKPGTIVLLAHTPNFTEKASAQLQVQASPTLTTSKTVLRVGESVVLSGDGFTPGKVVTIRLAGIDMGHGTTYGTATVDGNGRFSTQIFLGRYPDGTPLPPGGITLAAMTSDGEHALVGLQLVADPAISLNKVSIKPGEQILVNGQSFTPGAQVSVSMGPVDGSIGGNYGTVRADTNGRFSLWVMLASYPDGTPLKPGTIVLLAHTPDFSQKASAQLQITDRAPAAPSDLHITSLAKSTTSTEATVAELQWRDNSGNETGFRIQATFTRMNGGTDSQTWNVAANATGARVNFVAGGINPVTKVCFTVTAFNGQGSSPASNEVCALL